MKIPLSFIPPPELQEFIASYGILEIPVGKTEPYFPPPLAMSGFIINVVNGKGLVTSKIDNRDFFTDNAVVTGQVTSHVYGEMVRNVKSPMVFFKPAGMHRLFKNDLSHLTNNSKPLTEFLGQKEDSLGKPYLTT